MRLCFQGVCAVPAFKATLSHPTTKETRERVFCSYARNVKSEAILSCFVVVPQLEESPVLIGVYNHSAILSSTAEENLQSITSLSISRHTVT